jgi:hypothetical protein
MSRKFAYIRAWQAGHPERIKVYRKKASQKYSRHRRNFLQAIKKMAGCAICGRNQYAGGLDFHHIDPECKSFSLSKAGMPWEALVIEQDKCEVLCKYCHGAVESGELEWPAKT